MSENKERLFGIVTPSRNSGRYIEETIQSVLGQEEDGVQVDYIILDALSSDNTIDVLKRFRNRIEWRSEKDNGQSDAINQGLSQLKDVKYQAWIGADDVYKKGAFKTIAETFEKNPQAMWVVADSEIIDEHGHQILAQLPIRWYKKILRHFLDHGILDILNPIPQPSTFWRTEAMEQVGLLDTDLDFAMDLDFWARLERAFGPPEVIPKTIAKFRVHKASKGGAQYDKQFDEELEVAAKYSEHAWHLRLHAWHNRLIKFVYGFLK